MDMHITSDEKAELLHDAIERLYSKEGRSKSYIANLLGISRRTISRKIAEWDLQAAEPRRHATPSTRKWLNANRDRIKRMLDNDVPTTEIARVIGCSRDQLEKTAYTVDPVLKRAHDDMVSRKRAASEARIDDACATSCRDYGYAEIAGETWMPILGYHGYEVSDHGRIRRRTDRYDRYYLVHPTPNANNGRLYVMLSSHDGSRRNIQVARLVAHAFVDVPSGMERPTVDHLDGDVTNNAASNLEWVSQSENNRRAYERGRTKVSVRKFVFKKLVYKKRYEFKTIEALARFMGKSPTQVRRYLEKDPMSHDIEIVR